MRVFVASLLAMRVLGSLRCPKCQHVPDPNADPNVIKADWVSNYNIPDGEKDGSKVYSDLYNHLYQSGKYHGPNADGTPAKGSHAHNIVRYLRNKTEIMSVFDVGCSHGRGVEMLWETGKVAAGIDIAELGVQRAIAWRCQTPVVCNTTRCGAAASCFQVGSALAIPVSEKSYDAVISTDVLEHIFMDDVPKVLSEFTRVARKMIVVKVASMIELKNLAAELNSPKTHGIQNLHVTSQKLDWWKLQFEKVGWTLNEELQIKIYRGYYGGFEASFVPLMSQMTNR